MSRRLSAAYEAWKAQPFPPTSADDLFEAVRADLVLVDAWVAEVVVPFVERTQYVFAVADIAAGIRGVRERAEALAAPLTGHEAELARAYVTYAERLGAVYQELERTVEESGHSN